MRKIQLQTALIALFLMLIWWQAGLWYQSQLISEERDEVADHLHSQGNSLATSISSRLDDLNGLHAFVQAEMGSSPERLDQSFSTFARNIYSQDSAIINLAIAPKGVFQHVYPPDSKDMIGRSLFRDLPPSFRMDLERAIKTGEMVITQPHEMRRGGLGIVARRAVLDNGSFWGIVSMTIDARSVLQSSVNATSGGLNMALKDSGGHVFLGEESVFQSDPVIHRVSLPDGYWELAAVPVRGWAGSVQVPLRIAQMAGLIIIGLLVSLFYLAASREDFLSQMIREKTSDLEKELAERKRAEKALQERESHLRAIFEAAENVAFIIAEAKSSDPLILEFSPGAEKIFAYGREEVIGRSISILLSSGNQDKLANIISRIRNKSRLSGFASLVRKSQESFTAMCSLYPLLDERGEVYAALGVCIDVTDQKRMEAELVHAKEAAEASSRAKAEFTANVSHEMRTPLNAVIGMTDLLLESDLDPVKRDYVRTIRNSGLSLLSIINEILDYSKIDASKMDIVEGALEIRQTLEAAMEQVAPRAAEKRLELAYILADDLPERIWGDGSRLRQILVNLISNAIKFTESGEVTVLVDLDPEEMAYHFVVKDTGIGIPEDRMSRLFLPFSQVDTSLARRYDGTGLGLAISSELVGLMGGRIWAESKINSGSQFHFTIPATMDDARLIAAEDPSSASRPDYSPLRGKRALLVSDKESSRMMLARHLRSFGLSWEEAATGCEAAEKLEESRLDVAIVDADIQGIDILVQSLSRWDGQALPLIEVGFLGDKARLPSPVVAAFLTKPIRGEQLGGALLLIFGEKEASPAGQRPAPAPATAYSAYRILLAEDNPINQKVALAMLKHLGYQADLAANGREVLSSLEQKTYDVILMDIQMPEMDGLEATRFIRTRLPSASQPRIIAMTAYAMKGDREQCLAAGMDDYIGKPVKIEDLKRVLERMKNSD
jgi:PAS domain S-box-containing protein